MKLLNVLAVFAFIAVANGAVNECHVCFKESHEDCGNETRVCSDNTFPNLGTTHCYSAASYYHDMEDGQKKSGVVLGCGDCSDKDALKALFSKSFKEVENATLVNATFNIECCNSMNCNNQTLSPLSMSTSSASATTSVPSTTHKMDSTTPTSYATRLLPISGIVAFVAIILAVTL